MGAILQRLSRLKDVVLTAPADGDVLSYDSGTDKWVNDAGGGGGGAPTTVDYLVGTANGSLSAEIVVGASPGGELGGTWGSPTVDASHSGSTHAAVQAAAEATAAGALAGHVGAADPHTVYRLESAAIVSADIQDGTIAVGDLAFDPATQAELDAHVSDAADAHAGSAITNTPAGGVAATTVQAAINELDTDKAAASHVHAGEDITSGTVADARIASTIARDSEVTAAVSAHESDTTSVHGIADTSAVALTADVVTKALYDANTVLAADSDNTPAALTMGASTILARLAAGNIKAATPAELRTLLGLVVGTDVQAYDSDLGVIAALADPNEDRLLFWDDSAGAYAYLSAGTGLTITGTTIDASAGSSDGWTAAGETWTYASADSPTFTFTIAGVDLTSKYSAGMRVKLTQTTAKYFIITAVAFSTDTTITVYGGTDYTLANAAITLPFWSMVKAPHGFPLSPLKWQAELKDTTDRTQATPSTNTWYNVGSLSLSIPIGVWDVTYESTPYAADASGTAWQLETTLSTANNSESDRDFTAGAYFGNVTALMYSAHRRKTVALAAKTTHYANVRTQSAGLDNIYHFNSYGTLIIRAVCAYL